MTLLLANSLSPVMWRTLALLLVGNAIIGLIEGGVVARVFRFPPVRTIVLFIVANYCSMGFGAMLFGVGEKPSPLPEMLFDIPLHHAGAILWICVVISFAVSVVVEWPFCWIASLPTKAPVHRSMLAVLLAQAVSYPLLILLFADSENTIGDDVEVATLHDVVPESLDATVYFIGAHDGAAYSVDLDGSDLSLMQSIWATNRYDVLGWRPPSATGAESWQLVFDSRDRNEVLLENPDGRCEAFRSSYSDDVVRHGWWLGSTGVADLRPPDARDWVPDPGGNWGMQVTQESTQQEVHITFDTPFVSWWGRCVTILPGDIVVFELGQQVCVLSLPTRKIAFLARGRGPVVLLHEAAIGGN